MRVSGVKPRLASHRFFSSWTRGSSPSIIRSNQPRHLTSGQRLDGCTIISHARGIRLGKAEPTLMTACLSHRGKRSAHPDPTRLVRPLGFRIISRLFGQAVLSSAPFGSSPKLHRKTTLSAETWDVRGFSRRGKSFQTAGPTYTLPPNPDYS